MDCQSYAALHPRIPPLTSGPRSLAPLSFFTAPKMAIVTYKTHLESTKTMYLSVNSNPRKHPDFASNLRDFREDTGGVPAPTPCFLLPIPERCPSPYPQNPQFCAVRSTPCSTPSCSTTFERSAVVCTAAVPLYTVRNHKNLKWLRGRPTEFEK